jgi:hypothetical protein
MSATKPGLQITPAPTWHGRLAQPWRRIMLRLLAPMMGRFLTANDELWAANIELSRRLDEAHRRIDLLSDEIAAANALAWDQVALSRRLAELEDRLASRQVEMDSAEASDVDSARAG